MTIEYNAREALKKHGFRFNKSLGQNFLLDGDVISRIVELADIRPGERIVEIGAGAGVLTAEMARVGADVAAIEIDRNLEPVLRDVLSESKARVIIADALKYNIKDCFPGESFRVVANLPYYITTDVMLNLTKIELLESITVLVQKEAAGRIEANVGEEGYCALSAIVRLYGQANLLMDVPPRAFTPAPHVESTLMRVDRYIENPYDKALADTMRRVIKIAFGMRRKTLVNNLSSALAIDKTQAQSVVIDAGLPSTIRGEALKMDEIACISKELLNRNFL